MTLVDFLLARIAEDEAAARAGISSQADPQNGWGLIEHQGVSGLSLSPHVGHVHERVQGQHIIRWHPARVLAECEAKRAIVEGLVEANREHSVDFELGFGLHVACQRLAAVYADHPDYDPDWKP